MHKKTTAAVIVAAGKGLRAGFDLPKQYQALSGKTVLQHSTLKFSSFDHTVIVAHPDYFDRIKEVLPGVLVVAGGESRTQSVFNGIKALRNLSIDYVLIHDAARPMVTPAVIEGVLEGLNTAPAAVPVMRLVDAVKTVRGGAIGHDADRNALVTVQTPQGFHYAPILSAFEALPAEITFSDDIAVAVNAGMAVAQTPGDLNNFKITHPEDLAKAEAIMTEFKTCVGSGYDVHRLVDGDHMYLCGVRIDADKTLLGHSDADVGLHAITDAIFGAMAAGDIGDHFPPTDPQWKGASSDIFLREAGRFVSNAGGSIEHIDVTLICEAPKIKPHRDAMRARIGDVLGLPIDCISVKATTTEQLGFTGRGEGIAAQAVATIRRPR